MNPVQLPNLQFPNLPTNNNDLQQADGIMRLQPREVSGLGQRALPLLDMRLVGQQQGPQLGVPVLAPINQQEVAHINELAGCLIASMQQQNIPNESTGQYIDRFIDFIRNNDVDTMVQGAGIADWMGGNLQVLETVVGGNDGLRSSEHLAPLIDFIARQYEGTGQVFLHEFFASSQIPMEERPALIRLTSRLVEKRQFKCELGDAVLNQLRKADADAQQERINVMVQWNRG